MNENRKIEKVESQLRSTPALLHEMMRSFTALARTLNLSQAVEELGSTRQTVRRHITQLEDAMEGKLFDVQQRRYSLTDMGARAVAPAQLLLDQGGVWYQGKFQDVGGMLRFSFGGTGGWTYDQQQQPISAIWSGKSDLLRAAVKAWTMSEGKIESPHMAQVRPYVLAYREIAEGWICVEVGERSFYSNWFGWAEARSSVGRNLNQFPGGEEFASLANAPFTDVNSGHGMRLDQIVTRMRLYGDGPLQLIAFDRLLLGAQMPDGSHAIVSVVDRACEVRITDLEPTLLEDVPKKASVDFIP
ncbi:LysR family transcriptional regulator [Sulfitobacter sp. HNIBRBA2951]|uniref:LysR family transcriptional regulator n=1 Tax=Sulfitobacter aquimarinus TaxID=3158557 RepID=UPI0032DF5D10